MLMTASICPFRELHTPADKGCRVGLIWGAMTIQLAIPVDLTLHELSNIAKLFLFPCR